jgi:hypothetical protein
MKKVVIDFKPSAYVNYQRLAADKRWGGLAKRYYDELFDFPPEKWGRMRKSFGKDCFVSDRHTPFVIKLVIAEEKTDRLWLYVTQFTRREP